MIHLGLSEFKLFGLRIAAHSSLQVFETWQLAAMSSQSSTVRVQMGIVGYMEMGMAGGSGWLWPFVSVTRNPSKAYGAHMCMHYLYLHFIVCKNIHFS